MDKATDGNRTGLWFFGSFCLILVITTLTCYPLFLNPQLEPDDYRYLHLVQNLEEDFIGRFAEASLVENRWDHLWWIAADQVVRFYRPTVILSYWLDGLLYGDDPVFGLLLTNVLLQLACAALVAWILIRWLGPGLPALLGSGLFAAFLCHNEVIWYIAGRTDSMAALGFLAGLALHLSGSGRSGLRWLALPCYGFAFLSKELTVALPVICLLHDYFIEKRGENLKGLLAKEWKLYAGYGAVALAVQALRGSALSGSPSSLVYPYFISPLSLEFPSHLLTQLRNYSENLLIGTPSTPFLTPENLVNYSSTIGLVVCLIAVLLTLLFLRRDRHFLLFFAFGLLTWLPTSFVYVSERYLFLPSAALAATAGLALDKLRKKRGLWLVGLVLMVCWTGHQGYLLKQKHEAFRHPGGMQILDQQVAAAVDLPREGGKILLLNLWGNWLQAQFVEDAFRVLLDNPDLELRILTRMPITPDMGADLKISRENDRTLVVSGLSGPLLDQQKLMVFPWRSLQSGTRVEGARLGFSVEIIEGEEKSCQALRFTFDESLDSYRIYRFFPHPNQQLPPYARMRRGFLEAVKLP